MPSLFNNDDNNELIGRIECLTSNTPAQWGKMNAAQMISHLQEPMKVATGEAKLKHSLIGILFGRMAKKKMMKPGPFSKNLPTAPTFLRKDERDFEKEKAITVSLIKQFADKGPDVLSKNPHPFFGKMTVEEWDTLGWKHIDHHLTQFGV
jgi:hypothetical protein